MKENTTSLFAKKTKDAFTIDPISIHLPVLSSVRTFLMREQSTKNLEHSSTLKAVEVQIEIRLSIALISSKVSTSCM